ncbi:MAG TPA: hypothetical protein VFX15_02865 [Actinomycetes bacterium]|nr:hypothetical protein [Actinomycetes bacterium]
MADDEKQEEAPKGFVSTAEGAETNEPLGSDQERPKQTPDQFFDPSRDRPDAAEAPKSHATKGMTSLGYTEASRLENTAEQQERDRKAAERLATKSKD